MCVPEDGDGGSDVGKEDRELRDCDTHDHGPALQKQQNCSDRDGGVVATEEVRWAEMNPT